MPDINEILKRVKKLQSSVLISNPSVPDMTSELVRDIGIFSNDKDDKKVV